MKSIIRFNYSILTAAFFSLLTATSSALADEHMAKNLITVSTGSIPNDNDPKIYEVSRQLDRIERLCAATSKGAGIGDKIAYAHSQLKAGQSIYVMLNGFETIANRQCSSFDSGLLLGLYVLERNEGVSHTQAIASISTRPSPLIKKWSARPAK